MHDGLCDLRVAAECCGLLLVSRPHFHWFSFNKRCVCKAFWASFPYNCFLQWIAGTPYHFASSSKKQNFAEIVKQGLYGKIWVIWVKYIIKCPPEQKKHNKVNYLKFTTAICFTQIKLFKKLVTSNVPKQKHQICCDLSIKHYKDIIKITIRRKSHKHPRLHSHVNNLLSFDQKYHMQMKQKLNLFGKTGASSCHHLQINKENQINICYHNISKLAGVAL